MLSSQETSVASSTSSIHRSQPVTAWRRRFNRWHSNSSAKVCQREVEIWVNKLGQQPNCYGMLYIYRYNIDNYIDHYII
jgi:hypothetical protein